MEEESRFGMTIPCMKVIGLMTKLMEEEDSSIKMEMSTKEIGKMIKHMGKEYISIKMVPAILGVGSKMLSMVMV